MCVLCCLLPRIDHKTTAVFTDFHRFSTIFNDFQRCSAISNNFQRFSSIFNDCQRLSSIFVNVHQLSSIFTDFQRFSTILGRPAVSGSIGKKSTDSGRPAVQKSPFRGEKSLGVSANHFPRPQSKTLTKRSSREQGEKTSTTESGCQCQLFSTKSRPDLATTRGH